MSTNAPLDNLSVTAMPFAPTLKDQEVMSVHARTDTQEMEKHGAQVGTDMHPHSVP